jgi:hypothetical protein
MTLSPNPDKPVSHQALKFKSVSNFCYSFSALPSHYDDNSVPDEFCTGTYTLTNVKTAKNVTTVSTPGQLQIEAVRASFASQKGANLDEIVASLQKSYFPPQGTLKGKPELIKLDGVPAYKLSLNSVAEGTKSKDFIVVLKDPPYAKEGVYPVSLFIISETTPEDNGPEIMTQLVKTWKWN